MGSRGPAPKPSWARRRRNSPSTDVVVMAGEVLIPPPPRGLRKLARTWYQSLAQSAQAAYFEPSDWAAAAYVAVALSKSLESYEMSASLFKSVFSAMQALGTTEESRRRMHIEVARQFEATPPGTAEVEYRQRLMTPEEFEAERRRHILSAE